MNPSRLLALLLGLLALAGGLWYLAQRPAAPPGLADAVQTPEPAADSLLSLDPRSLVRLTLHRARFNETVRAERGEDGIWRLSEPLRDWCEPAVLSGALQALYERDWSPAPAEWAGQTDAELGLEPAQIAIEARAADGSSQVLRIGAADLAGRWQAATRDGARIRVGEGVLSRLDRDVEDWRDHRLQPLPPPAVRKLRWRAANGSALELERSGGGWRILAPYRAPLDERRAPFVERMLGARAEQIGRDALALRPLAGAPLGELSIEGGAETYRWIVHPGQLAASHRDFPLVWDPDDLALLFQPPEQLRSPRVLDLDAGAIVALRVELGEAAAVFRRAESGWKLDGTERALTPEELGFVEALLREGARLEGAEWGSKPAGPAAGRVIYSISRTPRPQPGRVLEWWTDAEGRVTVAAADADRAAPSPVNFDLAVRDLMRRIGAGGGQ